MSAAREQTEKRWFERVRLEIERGDVPVKVIDRRERQPPGPGDRLRRGNPDEQGADQTGTGGHSDELDIVELRVRFAQRLSDDGRDQLEVAARRNLRDDTPVLCVQFRLGRNDVGEDRSVRRDQRGGCLVARSLQAENQGARSGERRATCQRRPPSMVRHTSPTRAADADAACGPVTSQPRRASMNATA